MGALAAGRNIWLLFMDGPIRTIELAAALWQQLGRWAEHLAAGCFET